MRKFDPKALPYLAALAQFVQFGHAGYILGGWVLAVIGGIIGAVVSFSVAYAGSQVASINGQKREKWANAGTLVMLALSPLAIVAPVYNSFGVITNDTWRWITAVSWVLAPDLAILLDGLVTGKKLVAASDQSASSAGEAAPKKGRTAKSKSKMAQQTNCPYCSRPGTLGAINAHKGKCAKNPANQFVAAARSDR